MPYLGKTELEIVWLLPLTDGIELPVNLLPFPPPGTCKEDGVGGERKKGKAEGLRTSFSF